MAFRPFTFPILLPVLLFLAACAQRPPSLALPAQPQLPDFSTSFAARPALPTQQAVHRLTPAQEQAFLQYFNHPQRAGTPDYQRLLNYLYASTMGFGYDDAFWHAGEALRFDPFSAPALNMMAIIHRRTGDHARAERIYLYGIEHADDKLSLLKNYRLLLALLGRHDEAAAVQARLDEMGDPTSTG